MHVPEILKPPIKWKKLASFFFMLFSWVWPCSWSSSISLHDHEHAAPRPLGPENWSFEPLWYDPVTSSSKIRGFCMSSSYTLWLPSFTLPLKILPWNPLESLGVFLNISCLYSLLGTYDRCCSSLHHSLMSVGWLSCVWMSESQVGSVTRAESVIFIYLLFSYNLVHHSWHLGGASQILKD